ncbi:MAG: hypothetical protein M0005_06875 [Actinomycetota bacterium]|jgi:hypothetical protein|nr:hypothetical protein [Actinomycetota bacterium]
MKRTAGLAGQLEREAVLSWSSLRQLQAVSVGPSVSLFLWTTPAAVMTAHDATNLHRLASQARERLAHELKGQALEHMETRLSETVRAAESGPTDHGLALFVSAAETAVVPLPFSPRERVAINPRFATRDLLESLEAFPPYRALVLRGPGFRLLEGRAQRLSEVRDWQVPNPSLWRARRDDSALYASCWTPRQRRLAAFESADRAIGERVAIVGRLPLVLLGRKGLMAKYRRRSPHTSSVIGQVPVWGAMLSRADVAEQAAPLVTAWRQAHTAQYLEALHEADRQGHVVWGLQPVWDAVRAGQVQWLWVERDYWEPGRLGDRGTRLLAAPDLEAPGVTEDIVDLVMERAALAGAHVEIVERLGHGRAGDRIAAQLGAPAGAGERPQPGEAVAGQPAAGSAAAA